MIASDTPEKDELEQKNTGRKWKVIFKILEESSDKEEQENMRWNWNLTISEIVDEDEKPGEINTILMKIF